MDRAICYEASEHAYTISEGYASTFKIRYDTNFDVIRNIPRLAELDIKLSEKGKLIYQGAINEGRGLEVAIDTVDDTDLVEFGYLWSRSSGPIHEKKMQSTCEHVWSN